MNTKNSENKKMSWLTLLSAAKNYKKQIFIGQLFALIAVLSSLPIPLLFPMLIDEVLLKQPDWLVRTINNVITIEKEQGYIFVVLGVTLLLRVLYFLFNVLQIHLFAKISKEIIFNIREKILHHLEYVSVAEYEALGGAGISSKLVTDINTIDTFVVQGISKLMISILTLIGVASILLWINWILALILLTLNPTVITITTILGKKIRLLKKDENLKIETFQDALSETLDLFIQIRTDNQESRYMDKMIQNAKAIQNASSNFGWKSDASAQLSALIFLSGFEMLRATAMIMVLMSELSIGEMFAVMGYLWFMITPLQDILQVIFSYQNATTALERLNMLLVLQHEPQYITKNNPFLNTKANTIALDNVSFSYGTKEVLQDVSLEIPAGKTVALLGASGSGKSTLAHIIMGLYAHNSGDIKVDDISVKNIGLDQMREHISLVLQAPRMFNDTLRHNLTLGRDIDDKTLYKALEASQFNYVLEKLPDGLESKIGKEGVRLSGGERQRLAIARMLVSKSNVVIFDESTSALDIDTESMLFSSLKEHLNGKTILIIAHRQSTIAHADFIYILKDGRISESGTPQNLIKDDGFYKKFVTR